MPRLLLILAPILVVSTILLAPRTGAQAAQKSDDPFGPLTALAGTWFHRDGETYWEEAWARPSANSMVGATKLVNGGTTALYEFMVIEANESGDIALLLHHFNPGLRIWESEKDAPLRFELVTTKVRRSPAGYPSTSELIFQRDHPEGRQRIVYKFASAGEVVVTVENDNGDIWTPEVSIDFKRLP